MAELQFSELCAIPNGTTQRGIRVPPPPSSALPVIALWSGSAVKGPGEPTAAKLGPCLPAQRKQQNTNQLCFMNIVIYKAGVEFF